MIIRRYTLEGRSTMTPTIRLLEQMILGNKEFVRSFSRDKSFSYYGVIDNEGVNVVTSEYGKEINVQIYSPTFSSAIVTKKTLEDIFNFDPYTRQKMSKPIFKLKLAIRKVDPNTYYSLALLDIY